MSAEPSEPEKYSIDEMMDRLKHPASANPKEGQLVTRSDGSQLLRIRKRKRRTRQPYKEGLNYAKRARILQVVAALVLVFAATLIGGGAVIYANSSIFRKDLTGKIAQATGASVELMQFRMNPQTANASKLIFEWPDGNALKTATLSGIKAEILPTSFMGKTLKGEEVTAAEGTITLQIPKPGQALSSVLTKNEPLAILFNRYRVRNFNIKFGDPTTPEIQLSKSEASLNPGNVNGRPEINLYKGVISMNGWPNLRLDRATLEFRGKKTNVSSLHILHETDDRGSLDFSGLINPFEPNHASILAVHLESFHLSGLIGSSFGRHFSGRIDSSSSAKSNFTFLPSSDPAPILNIVFRRTPASRIEVHGFPFLSALAQVLDDSWFEHPVFEADAAGTIRRENGIISLRDLNFESRGRLALRGEISLNPDQSLSGILEVGVAEAMIVASKSARLASMFGPTKEGYRWATLKVAGPVVAPGDNFKEQFSAVVLPAEPNSDFTEPRRASFEELTQPKK